MVNSSVKVNVPGLSSFDKSFKNIFTTKVGTLTPMVSKLVIPGAKGKMKISVSAALPPLASDCFMRCDFKVEAFLVPLRLLYGGFESWLTGKKLGDTVHNTDVVCALPRVFEGAGSSHPYFAPGTLADYLGMRCDSSETITSGSSAFFNIFKFLAYHRVYDDWYRNAKIQQPVFCQPMMATSLSTRRLSNLPYVGLGTIDNFSLSDQFFDGVHLGDLRQRNWGDDYFTIASPSAQQGSVQSISTSGNSFTIASLRAANSLQQFAERSNIGSPRLQDYVRSHYGASLNSGIAQRAILLGSASYPVYSKGVEGTATTTATNNPFTSVGARYGNAFASGTDFVCEFEANEPSILLVIGSLVPEANYSTGISRDALIFTQNGSQVDLPDPLLENVGNEPIDSTELTGGFPISGSGTYPGQNMGVVFGYVPRNTWYKTSQNEVHGLLRAGQALASFIPQRSLAGLGFSISSAFLEIPTNALDGVTAVTAALSTYGVWVDSFIDLKVAEPLVESAMPSLQDPAYEHGKTVSVKYNGSSI